MKTKKNVFLILALIISLGVNAQLKVRTNGSIHTGYTGYANIWMGTSPGAAPYQNYDNGKWAIEVWGDNLNIWKSWPSIARADGEGNYYMFFTPSGAIGVGQVPTHAEICLDVNGKVYSSGVELTSDERLKTDIKNLTGKFEKIYQLNGKSYKKHSKEEEVVLQDILDDKGNVIKKYEKSNKKAVTSKEEFGFLAQELKEVYPELVSQDTLGYYYVNYIGLIPVLVEALKEQKAEIEALGGQLKTLNSGAKKVAASHEDETDIINYPVLDQNVPNPFNTSTTITYYLPITITNASIYVYDMNGVQLKSYPVTERGKGNVIIQSSELIAGMYLYALIADGKVIDTKRMILTK
jgi:hypothetical protein